MLFTKAGIPCCMEQTPWCGCSRSQTGCFILFKRIFSLARLKLRLQTGEKMIGLDLSVPVYFVVTVHPPLAPFWMGIGNIARITLSGFKTLTGCWYLGGWVNCYILSNRFARAPCKDRCRVRPLSGIPVFYKIRGWGCSSPREDT